MVKTEPIAINMDTHGLAGNFVLPEHASPDQTVPGVLIVGGPGPAPMQRYSTAGAKNWPVVWSEALGAAGLAAMCYDQRGSGLSTGEYHDADWAALYEDAKAAAELLGAQPEVGRTAAVAWGDGCAYALRLAAEGLVSALVLMAPPYHSEEFRYTEWIRRLAAQKGLSERVVTLRVNQWKNDLMSTVRRVEQGETKATVTVGDQPVTTNLVRYLQTVAYDPAPAVARVNVPVLLLHGADDTVIHPSESEAMAQHLPGPAQRITYQGAAHFLYRHAPAQKDAVAWLKQTLA
jgi:pimeloyl-ACP methyl ester carboxylesterase